MSAELVHQRLRLAHAAKVIFSAINNTKDSRGILFGGAAAIFQGSRRITNDLDINVTTFPDTSTLDDIYERKDQDPDKPKKKITFKKDDVYKSVKCDISVGRAQELQDLLPYTVKAGDIEGVDLSSVYVAGAPLLLADKIRTFASRSRSHDEKAETDLDDIQWCIEEMFSYDKKLDERLKKLYTIEDWNAVKTRLDPDLIYVAEKQLNVIAEE